VKKDVTFIKEDKSLGLEVCGQCGKENYAMMVLKGICAWCGYNVNEKQV
jgi:ribosomal protein L37E